MQNLPKFINGQTTSQVSTAQANMNTVQSTVLSTISNARGSAIGQINTMLDQLRTQLASTSSEVASYSKYVNVSGVVIMLLCLVTPIIGTVSAVVGFLFFHSQVPPDKRDGLGNLSGKGLGL